MPDKLPMRTCPDCGKVFQPKYDHNRRCTLCSNRALYLSWAEYISAMHRLLQFVGDAKLSFWDCNIIGNKDNECTWGMCTKAKEVWPDPDNTPHYRQVGQLCPFDRGDALHESWRVDRELWEQPPTGCFYRCMYFSPTNPRPDREAALLRIEAHIQLLELWVKQRTVSNMEGVG